MESKRICIIGAGVSGLSACKQALDGGFNPVVFESSSDIGGVWSRTIDYTKIQTPTVWYQFSDFPWPEHVTDPYPGGRQVKEYLWSYARHFGVSKCIKFEHRVVGIEYVGAKEEGIAAWESWAGNGEAFGNRGGRWHVTVEHEGTFETYQMDFVILCIGRFSGLPNIPTFPEGKGTDVFQGKVMHSLDYSNMGTEKASEIIKDKLVTVIGSGKSAVDVADDCSNINGSKFPCTILFRTKHWLMPDWYVWFGIPLGFLYLNRFSELLVHKPGEGFLLWLLATILSPLRWLFSKFCESYYKSVLPMKKHGMIPDHSFFEGMTTSLIAILPAKLYNKVEEGSIVLKKMKGFSFCKNGVIIEGENSPIKSDVVIFGTGFQSDQKLKDIFKSSFFRDIVAGSPSSTVPLYREIIHPRIPQLAIVGYSESLSNLYTSELRSKWLIHFLGGRFKLPSIRSMEKDVIEWEKYMKRYAGPHFRRSSIGILHIWYNDQLCRDMGYNPKRKKGFFADLLLPYGPGDYADITSKK
ncbi:Flavin-containing monooxygenase [Rhynchospora pubera]|uniref:Flavin-containing monooxygenase n=1 Tax=Rhynchospora pubera TaxID=906938 RepID=A0AAV8E9H6_9POAL|nr:Flavin-containing monooxygenase [Rhynchospora pubera]